MVWDARTHCDGEYRTAIVSLNLPYEILMRLVCSGSLHFPKVAAHFTSLADSQLEPVAGYLKGFLTRILTECDTHSMELHVREDRKGSDFDFPRPSPSFFFIREFCQSLARHRPLYEALKSQEFRSLGLVRNEVES